MIYTTIKFNKFINVILKYIFFFTIDVQLRDKFNKVELDALFYLVYNVGLSYLNRVNNSFLLYSYFCIDLRNCLR